MEKEISREESLNAIGQGYIDMKNNKAKGFMVVLEGDPEKLPTKIKVVSFSMAQEEVLSSLFSILLSMGEEINAAFGEEDEE